MKTHCERCRAPLSDDGEAYICSYECTYCTSCRSVLRARCSQCDGELVRRPLRKTPFAPA